MSEAALPPEAQEAEHQALRSLREAFVAAYNRMDLDAMLALLDDNVAFTPLNGDICHGQAQVRAYYDKMMKGPHARVKGASVDGLEADRLTTLYGGSFGVSTGWADTTYHLAGGLKFSARVRWSNSLSKHSGTWKIVAMHVSTDIFDNPYLSLVKKAAGRAGAVVGGLLGGLLGWLLRRG